MALDLIGELSSPFRLTPRYCLESEAHFFHCPHWIDHSETLCYFASLGQQLVHQTARYLVTVYSRYLILGRMHATTSKGPVDEHSWVDVG